MMTGERLSPRCGFEWGLHVCNQLPEHEGDHCCGGYLPEPLGRCRARTESRLPVHV